MKRTSTPSSTVTSATNSLASATCWAAGQGYDPVWVATGPEAAGFYRRCGWELTHTYRGQRHDEVNILRYLDGG